MLGFSIGEILFLLILALVVIGPKELPEVARNIARFLNELKRTTNSFTEEMKAQARVDFEPRPRPKLPTEPPAAETIPELPPHQPDTAEEKKHES